MEKLDHSGKPLIISSKQRIDVASSPIASIDLSEQNVKQISSLVQKYTQVSHILIQNNNQLNIYTLFHKRTTKIGFSAYPHATPFHGQRFLNFFYP